MYKGWLMIVKPDIFQRDLNITRNMALKTDQKQTNQFFCRFFNIFDILLETHVPLKKLTIAEVKLHLKIWITNGRQKDKIYEHFQKQRIARAKEKHTKN